MSKCLMLLPLVETIPGNGIIKIPFLASLAQRSCGSFSSSDRTPDESHALTSWRIPSTIRAIQQHPHHRDQLLVLASY
jgi:hypothetical protein